MPSPTLTITGRWKPPKATPERIADFERWASSSNRQPTFTLDSAAVSAGIALTGTDAMAFRRTILDAVNDPNALVSISLNDDIVELLAEHSCEFHRLRYSGNRSIIWNGIRAQTFSAGSNLEIRNSEVGTLSLHTTSTLSKVWVSKAIVAGSQKVRRLVWSGGYLGEIQIPVTSGRVTDDPNPLSGDIRLREVHFNPVKELHGIQWLRDVRGKLLEKNNAAAAGVFHSAELRLAEKDEPFPVVVVSKIYRWGSDYGNLIGRPILWSLLFWGLIVLTAFCFGTSAQVEPTATGWQTALQDNSWTGKTLRAAVYSLQSLFNPLNLLGSKPLVSSNHWAGALLGSLFGACGIILIAVFLLSVRRRFKLE